MLHLAKPVTHLWTAVVVHKETPCGLSPEVLCMLQWPTRVVYRVS